MNRPNATYAAVNPLPVRILVADGDSRKLQYVFEIHTDVDVLGMR